MSDNLGLVVEFKAKYDTVTSAFKGIATSSSNLIAKNRQVQESFTKITDTAKLGADTILNKWLGLGVALSAGALVEFFNHTAESIDNLTDTARGLGVTTDQLQKLSYAAKLGGVGADEITDSLKKFNITVGQAREGNESAIASFKAVGISIDSLKGKDLTQQFLATATAASKVGDNNKAAAASAELFGRSYTSALKLGRDGIAENIEAFDKLGLKLTDTQREAVGAFGDAKDKFNAIFGGFSEKVVAEVAPALTGLINQVSEFVEASGGIEGLATNVGSKIVTIIDASVSAFKLITNTVGTILDKFDQLKNSKIVQSLALGVSDAATRISTGVSDGSTGSNAVNFASDFFGNGIKSSLTNVAYPFSVAPASFNNYNPNNVVANRAAGNRINGGGADAIAANLTASASLLNTFSASTVNITSATDKATSSIQRLGEQSSKSSDLITGGFKSLGGKGVSEEVNKIFGIIGQNDPNNGKRDDPFQTFENDAATLVQQLKNGGVSTEAFNEQLSVLRGDIRVNQQAGFSTAGQADTIEEIKNYAKSLGVDKQQVEVGLKIELDPGLIAKYTDNNFGDGAKVIAQIIGQAATLGAK